MSHILIIGANHAGIAAANTILDNYPGNSVTILDRNTNLSYLGCGTALWVGQQIDSYEQLFYTNKDALAQKGADIHMETTVEAVDFDAKTVTARSRSGETRQYTYDKLILATGSVPITPNIPGANLRGIQSVKLFQDGKQLDEALKRDDVKNVAVVGAGYIGVEIAEAIKRRGKNVRLFEAASTSLSAYYDEAFSSDMDKVLVEGGVDVHYGEMVQEYKGDGQVTAIVTDKGEYAADLVVTAIGFRAHTALGKDSLELLNDNAYKVNKKQQTSRPDVYAVGDCATVFHNALQDSAYIALATNAVRSGIVAGHNAAGGDCESLGVQGSNGISIFGYNMVSTGLSVTAAKKCGLDVAYTDFEDLQRPSFMKKNHPVKIRIVYETGSRRIVGAQLASYEDVSATIHMFSLAIQQQVTIDTLKLLDIFFLPHFNQPYNYITMAALSAK